VSDFFFSRKVALHPRLETTARLERVGINTLLMCEIVILRWRLEDPASRVPVAPANRLRGAVLLLIED
jgi:hypothetical protein